MTCVDIHVNICLDGMYMSCIYVIVHTHSARHLVRRFKCN